jgi:hypothetical protein
MILLIVWAFVAGYFLLLLYAVGIEMAVAGSIIFVLWAAKITFTVLRSLLEYRPQSAPQPQAANQNHPPQ